MLRRALPILAAAGACRSDPPCERRDCVSTAVTASPAPAGPSTPLQVLDVEVCDGPLPVDRALVATLSRPARIAALCTADEDPTEQHLVTSGERATSHELRVQGLLPDTAYTCLVAPIDPQMQGPPVSVPVVTGPDPDLPRLEVEVDPELGMTGHYTLVSYLHEACSENPRYIVLYDAEGNPRWWHQLPQMHWVDVEALWHPEDQAIVWGGGEHPEGRARVLGLWDGERAAVPFPDGPLDYNHDAKRLPDGRILTLDYRPIRFGSGTFRGFGVQVHDLEAGRVDFELSAQRYVDEGTLPGAARGDLYHANWVDLVPGPDGSQRLYVSLCYLRSILAIDAATGQIRYEVAEDRGWTVLDEGGVEIGEQALPRCSHGNELVGDDVLLVYDNGRGRGESQVVEWAFDPATKTAQRRWRWTEPGWFQPTLGDVDDLGGGRVLVTEAHPECWADTPGDRSEIVEVDRATGRVASRLRFPSSDDAIYRSERYDGCAMFTSTRACPALAEEARALAPIAGW